MTSTDNNPETPPEGANVPGGNNPMEPPEGAGVVPPGGNILKIKAIVLIKEIKVTKTEA